MVKIIYLKIQNQNSHLRTNNCRYRSWKYPSQQEPKAVKNKKSECKYRYPITQHVSHNHFLSIKRVTHFLVNKVNASFVFTKVCHSIYSQYLYWKMNMYMEEFHNIISFQKHNQQSIDRKEKMHLSLTLKKH